MSERDLWANVVLQAGSDVAHEPYYSLDHSTAVSFFITESGEWAAARTAIADHLGLHPDDLERYGRAVMDARRDQDGGPPARLAPSVREWAGDPRAQTTGARAVVTRAPVGRRLTTQDEKRDRGWWIARFMASNPI